MRGFFLSVATILVVLPVAAEAPNTSVYSKLERQQAAGPRPGAAAERSRADYLTFKSDYTPLNLDKCERVAQSANDEEGPGWVHWRCDGLTEDWPVHVYGGDPGYLVSYGENADNETARAQTVGHFNRLHTTLEWVMEKKDKQGRGTKPIATILRYFVEIGEMVRKDGGVPPKGDYPILVVTQLKPGAVCHVAYVDAHANKLANLEARKAAYRLAGDFDCANKPEPVGPQTPGLLGE